MKRFCLTALMILASGCATTMGFQDRMDSWVGDHIDSYLTVNARIPARVLDDVRGGKIYEFSFQTIGYYMTPTTPETGYGVLPTVLPPRRVERLPIHSSCVWRFRVDSSGFIQSWSARGDACASTDTKPRNPVATEPSLLHSPSNTLGTLLDRAEAEHG